MCACVRACARARKFAVKVSKPRHMLGLCNTLSFSLSLYIYIFMKDEYNTITSMSDNIATLLAEPLVLVPFILKLCNVSQYLFSSAFNSVSSKSRT